ncbi:hypothetical protein BY996DRAFT_7311924 [Phakopsora pachyrhizi]|nr:hypothetical protein BY996DRAFT_7311924 [Phakopsora pachyrhizi]
MNELVKLQRISEVTTESKLENNLIRHRRGSGGGSSDGEDEVLIYSTNLPKNWLRTADGMLASTLGIVAASGYLAQHFRHYGSIPVWPNSDCDWSGIRYERLDESIRFLISVGLISLSSFRALKVFNKLSLDVSRMTIVLPSTRRFKELAEVDRLIRSSETVLRIYPIGSQNIIYPINRLFIPFKDIKISRILRFFDGTDRLRSRREGYQTIGLKDLGDGYGRSLSFDIRRFGHGSDPGSPSNSWIIDGLCERLWRPNRDKFQLDEIQTVVKRNLENLFEPEVDLSTVKLRDLDNYKFTVDPRRSLTFNLRVILSSVLSSLSKK